MTPPLLIHSPITSTCERSHDAPLRILGISPLDRDSTASLYLDGAWSAVAEERLTRVRLQAGFPRNAVEALFEMTGAGPDDIDVVAYPFKPWWIEASRMLGGYGRDLGYTLVRRCALDRKVRHLRAYAGWCAFAIATHARYHRELERELRKYGLDRKLIRIEHHYAHAAAAYLSSGFEEALAVTLDWYGGGLSGSVSRCKPDGITRLRNFDYPHSTGLFYSQVTSALGFKPSRHEGKIVGLAAYGDSRVLAPVLLECFERGPGDFRYICAMDGALSRDLARRYPREEVAAAYQWVLEDLVGEVTKYWLRETGIRDVVLAGGVAANVRMNQSIAELDEARRVFIHPNMGDGGAGVGATLAILFDRGLVRSQEWPSCYLGPRYTEEEMEAALLREGLTPERLRSVPDKIARLLADGFVVARFDGPLEYGPRALGNRSILCEATDHAVNDWLNRQLGRTEFMPFAPVTLFERSRERYSNVENLRAPTRFMTLTCGCTELMRRESPAAVHIDGTARPQIVREEENPEYYRILHEYYRLTGLPTLINTSFNQHEEPIVCSPDDAVRAFVDSGLHYLSMGNLLVESAAAVRPTPWRESRGPLADHPPA